MSGLLLIGSALVGLMASIAAWRMSQRLMEAPDRVRLRRRTEQSHGRARRIAQRHPEPVHGINAAQASASPHTAHPTHPARRWADRLHGALLKTLDDWRVLEALSRGRSDSDLSAAAKAHPRDGLSAAPTEQHPPAHANEPASGTAEGAISEPAVTPTSGPFQMPIERPNQEPGLELRLARAGFVHARSASRLLVLKSVLFLLLPTATALTAFFSAADASATTVAAILTLSAAAAHYGPDAVLAWMTTRRRDHLQAQLPGFTDLLQVCVQAGMGLDAAIQRVVRDHSQGAPELSALFQQVSLEMRAGVARQTALQRLALVGHTDDLRQLVTMLVQAEQFGTSLAEALRQQADDVRARRMAQAEERAARIPVLMLIPLVLCIFPALMVVLMGPAVIQMMTAFA